MRLKTLPSLVLIIKLVVLLAAGVVLAQDDEGIIMLEEITITVEAEMPNVLVTIPRKDPVIKVGELRRPEDSSLFNQPIEIKPKLVDIEINKMEKPEKILAKDRK